RRYEARGGQPGTIPDLAIWAVPFGIVGGRLYHVITDHQLYFGPGGSGLSGAIRIWDGGLGIWGAIALGAVGAWIGARRKGVALLPVADAIAPGIAVAQAVGRLGNWFNQELFGSPTDLPWGLRIDLAHRPPGFEQYTTFHPTFLYEALWMLGVAAVLVWADRRFTLGHGRVFALYIALYCLGRVWIEALRIDEANHILGLRLNVWTSIVVGLGGLLWFVLATRLRPGREVVAPPPEDLPAS
ncbi:MAG: prolipoprotein diacylglyceryl transferase, partial [Candidatus Nanopelagicales bacterium]|nr:prolipoprotein diacylglyceryl transferase [Candidatus Nanopelagicales bacterium]